MNYSNTVFSPQLFVFCPCQLPYFMNELTLTELDMGSATPRILGASKPSIDYRGKRELNTHTQNQTLSHTLALLAHYTICLVHQGLRLYLAL